MVAVTSDVSLKRRQLALHLLLSLTTSFVELVTYCAKNIAARGGLASYLMWSSGHIPFALLLNKTARQRCAQLLEAPWHLSSPTATGRVAVGHIRAGTAWAMTRRCTSDQVLVISIARLFYLSITANSSDLPAYYHFLMKRGYFWKAALRSVIYRSTPPIYSIGE